MPLNPRTVAATGPRSNRLTTAFAQRVYGTPQLALACMDNGFPMQVFFYLCDLESFIVVRTVMPLYSENIHGLYCKQSARQWAADLQTAGFRPLQELTNGLRQTS